MSSTRSSRSAGSGSASSTRPGFAGISWPEEYGGRGATLIEQAVFAQEMARAEVPPPANILGLAMGGPVVIAHGTEEQKQRYLKPILTAEEIWCQGFSEPESGSDLASLKTRAVKDGNEWVVTGQKVWTTLAQYSKWCMLVARTDADAPKHKGLTYFLMDMEQDAVQVRPLVQITGEGEFNELFIEEARIPEENVVGGVGNGWMVAITTLMNERAGLAFGAIAQIHNALNRLMELAKETRTNGGVAADDSYYRQRLAQLYIEAETMRLNAYRGLTKTMETGIPGPEGSLGKWQWADINQDITELALEIEGAYAPLARGADNAVASGALAVRLPALPRQLDRGRDHRHPSQHHRRARPRPSQAALGRLCTSTSTTSRRRSRRPPATSSPRASSPSAFGELAEGDSTFDESDWKEMAELGWTGLALPGGVGRPGPRHRRPRRRHGGDGLRARSVAALLEHDRRPRAGGARDRRPEGALPAPARRGRAARHTRPLRRRTRRRRSATSRWRRRATATASSSTARRSW